MKWLYKMLSLSLVLINSSASSQSFEPLNLSDPAIHLDSKSDHRVYLIGETHGVDINSEIQFKFFRSLHKRFNVTKLILELPVSYTIPITRFLVEGDTSFLKVVLFDPEGSSVSTKENLDFFSSVYRYNQSLDQKIEALCIDIEQKPLMTCLNILSLLEPYKAQDEKLLYMKMSLMEAVKKDEEENYKVIAKSAYNHFLLNRPFFEQLLKPNELEILGNSLYNFNQTYLMERDDLMFDNFYNWIESRDPDTKFFGQLGAVHTIKDQSSISKMSFRLTKSRVQNKKLKICTVMLLYHNCSKIGYEGKYSMGLVEPEVFEMVVLECSSELSISAHLKQLKEYRKLKKKFDYLVLIQNREPMKSL